MTEARAPLPSGLIPGESDPSIKAHRFAHRAMATTFEIVCAHEDRGYAEQAARAAFDLLDRLETELTCHRNSGDVSRINSLKAGESTMVGMWTMECLLLSRHFYNETGGAFDVSLGSGLNSVEVIPADFLVRVHADGVRLDLGGIGKGYSIDRANELLEEWEIRQVLLHGGFSSVLALDPPPGREGWPLTISLPGSQPARVLARVEARRQAWSASGSRKKDHIVNPRTRSPVRNRPAVWVSGGLEALAATCPREARNPACSWPQGIFETGDSPAAIAEALSTACMILTFEEIADYCVRHPGVEVRVLTSDPSEPSAAPLMVHYSR